MKYEVLQYFDDHLEGSVGEFGAKEAAEKRKAELEKKPRVYVSWEIREKEE